jgi:hypothetical protein
MTTAVLDKKPSAQASGSGSSREKFAAPYAGMPGFDDVLMSRIEKADKRIGVISVEECMSRVNRELHEWWAEAHAR